MEKILIVEDEKEINDIVSDYLSSLGYTTVQCFNGREALRDHDPGDFNLLILDLMIPGLDGVEVARRLREKSDLPIIMLTARDSEADKVLGLEIGADAYMTKPFSIRELGAQVRAVLRRCAPKSEPETGELISHKEVEMDLSKRKVMKDGKEVKLTTAQFDLLRLLISTPGKVFSRSELIETLSGYEYEGYERTIDVQVKNLRKALEKDPSKPEILLTVWGIGYKVQE